MKRISITFYIIFALLSAALFSCGNNELRIYVSPDGSDQATGTLSNPIATLKHAAELARAKAGKVPVSIFLSGGYYRLKGPLELGIHDGGIADAPVLWQAMPGENPIISGGVPVRNWIQEDDGMWSAILPGDYHGNFRSFYVNGKRAVRARFPDNDFLKVTKAGEDNRTNFFFEKAQTCLALFMELWLILFTK